MNYSKIKQHYDSKFGTGMYLIEFPDEDIIVTLGTGESTILENIYDDGEDNIYIEAKDDRLIISYCVKS